MSNPAHRLAPEVTTWVMRAMGSAFDPEQWDEYTGGRLHKFPVGSPPAFMGYWRECGYLRAVRSLTPEESAWILANPEAFADQARQFQLWKNSLAK